MIIITKHDITINRFEKEKKNTSNEYAIQTYAKKNSNHINNNKKTTTIKLKKKKIKSLN